MIINKIVLKLPGIDAYSEPFQQCKIELSAIVDNNYNLLTLYVKEHHLCRMTRS